MKRIEAMDLLSYGFTHSVKDPLWQNVKFTAELKNLLGIEDVQKLSRIKQNGPAFHIYPGAVHTRLDHSIGVYYLGREILLSLSGKSEELPFTRKGMMSFLASCLLHDIGHFPYAHSLKELPLEEHEEIAARMILRDGDLRKAIASAGADPEMVASIIDTRRSAEDEETGIYRSILSGTLDPDKMDYLSRDAFFAGLPYGRQDTDFIISSLFLAGGRIVLDEEAMSLVEYLLFSKYILYRNLYWHKGVRSATAMIKKAMLLALEEGEIEARDLYILDDYDFADLYRKHSDFEPFRLIDMVEHNRLLERKAFKDYDEDGFIERNAGFLSGRLSIERRIYMDLLPHHPELKEHEVIIDIPEPIHFETGIPLLSKDGSIRDSKETRSVFSSGVFEHTLRKVALYLPEAIPEEEALKCFWEIENGE